MSAPSTGWPAARHRARALLLILARDLGHLAKEDFSKASGELDEIARMLHGLRVKVEQGA